VKVQATVTINDHRLAVRKPGALQRTELSSLIVGRSESEAGGGSGFQEAKYHYRFGQVYRDEEKR